MAPPRAVSNLKELREQRKLSLEAVGVLAGCDKATVSRIERGLTVPHKSTVVRLARGLGVSAKRMQKILTAPVAEDSIELTPGPKRGRNVHALNLANGHRALLSPTAQPTPSRLIRAGRSKGHKLLLIETLHGCKSKYIPDLHQNQNEP